MIEKKIGKITKLNIYVAKNCKKSLNVKRRLIFNQYNKQRSKIVQTRPKTHLSASFKVVLTLAKWRLAKLTTVHKYHDAKYSRFLYQIGNYFK